MRKSAELERGWGAGCEEVTGVVGADNTVGVAGTLVGCAGLVVGWVVLGLGAGLEVGATVWSPAPPEGVPPMERPEKSWRARFSCCALSLGACACWEVREEEEGVFAICGGALGVGVMVGDWLAEAGVVAGRVLFPWNPSRVQTTLDTFNPCVAELSVVGCIDGDVGIKVEGEGATV